MTEWIGVIRALQNQVREYNRKEEILQKWADEQAKDQNLTPDQKGELLRHARIELKKREEEQAAQERANSQQHSAATHTLTSMLGIATLFGGVWLLMWLIFHVFLPVLGSALGFRHDL